MVGLLGAFCQPESRPSVPRVPGERLAGGGGARAGGAVCGAAGGATRHVARRVVAGGVLAAADAAGGDRSGGVQVAAPAGCQQPAGAAWGKLPTRMRRRSTWSGGPLATVTESARFPLMAPTNVWLLCGESASTVVCTHRHPALGRCVLYRSAMVLICAPVTVKDQASAVTSGSCGPGFGWPVNCTPAGSGMSQARPWRGFSETTQARRDEESARSADEHQDEGDHERDEERAAATAFLRGRRWYLRGRGRSGCGHEATSEHTRHNADIQAVSNSRRHANI